MNVLLLIPPFTQINTPYPATAYLKQYLVQQGVTVKQMDMGLELFLTLYSKQGLSDIFSTIEKSGKPVSKQNKRFLYQADRYIQTIEPVVSFLQTKETSLAYTICKASYLPKGQRFQQVTDSEWLFGSSGLLDRALYYSTLYLEELSDFIKAELIPDFGFSRYAERLSLSANSFDPIQDKLDAGSSYLEPLIDSLLSQQIQSFKPDLVGMTIPFPGCLFGALQCCKVIKSKSKSIKTVLGGGYISTELRELEDSRIFQYADYLILDDGELPIMELLNFLDESGDKKGLIRTFCLENGKATFYPGDDSKTSHAVSGFPDYSDLDLKRYLSLVDIPNPMHRLWNDGHWNKLTVAKGCYWKKCAFCDVSLSYIRDYDTVPASVIVDRMEKIYQQTGFNGFHFVDEAAPPALLKQIALEILKRGLQFFWWTNIRFEKNFTRDLCQLLSKSGCVAVSGGLETVSDRLLKLMNKGITIPQAVKVLDAFHQSGILIHAYLMYGFPTQTDQETIDSLEIVRQLFENELLNSCFWHRFSLTAHSLIAADPARFKIRITGPEKKGFAWNDLQHNDSTGGNHDWFSTGLEKAVYNFMYDVGTDFDLREWFDFDIPFPTTAANFVEGLLALKTNDSKDLANKKLIWLGGEPELQSTKTHKKSSESKSKCKLTLFGDSGVVRVSTQHELGVWICNTLSRLKPNSNQSLTYSQISSDYESKVGQPFNELLNSPEWIALRNNGLLMV